MRATRLSAPPLGPDALVLPAQVWVGVGSETYFTSSAWIGRHFVCVLVVCLETPCCLTTQTTGVQHGPTWNRRYATAKMWRNFVAGSGASSTAVVAKVALIRNTELDRWQRREQLKLSCKVVKIYLLYAFRPNRTATVNVGNGGRPRPTAGVMCV